jgi:cobalt-zinc-cadmium resistance protein CzcA
MNRVVFIIPIVLGASLGALYGEELTLEMAVAKALQANPSFMASISEAKKEESLIRSSYALEDPKLSYQRLNRGNKTNYWGVSQKIEFPTAYFYRGRAQSEAAKSKRALSMQTRFNLRGAVIHTYVSLFSINKMIELTRANMSALREIARTAERRYSAGEVTQADSMRAHVEQTKLEAKLRVLEKQRHSLLAELRELMAVSQSAALVLPAQEIIPPKYASISTDLEKAGESYLIKARKHQALAATEQASEKFADFFPDIQARYQRGYSGSPSDSDILMLEASVPLWFWGPQGKYQAAAYERDRRRAELSATQNQIESKVFQLTSNLETQYDLLNVYKDALIPQATTSYNATSNSYRAGKSSFLDLLERERFLFDVQIEFYEAVSEYFGLLVKLESVLGKELFSLSSVQSSEVK